MGTTGIAHEEQTYDEVLEMSETAPPANVRNKSNLYQGPANVKNTHDLYDDLHIPQLNGFKRNVIRWLKGVALVVNNVVLIALIIFLGIREGTDILEKNGGWSVWSDWTNCSATCDTGVQTRHRQCNNPVPSNGGQYCKGSAMDVNLCNREHCPRTTENDNIAFTAAVKQTSLEHLPVGTTVLFDHLTLSTPTFDIHTGVFTCPQSGLYLFSIFVNSATQKVALVQMVMDGTAYTSASTDGNSADNGGNLVILNVKKGSRVWVETFHVNDQSLWPWRTTFSGVLIHRHDT